MSVESSIWLSKFAAQQVFTEMGSGHSESVYEAAMAIELSYNDQIVTRQVPCPLIYRGYTVGVGYIDILIPGLPIELKSVAKLAPKDVQQVRKYLQAMDLENGLLINFGNDLEIVEVTKQIPGVIEVPFSLSSEDEAALKEAWEKDGVHDETPSSES